MSQALDMHSLGNGLEDGTKALGIDLDSGIRQKLLDYIALLHKWNRAYNLTAIRDPSAMVGRHILDSLSILPWVKGPRVLDVGAGAGLPGIVLAIANPELQVSLLDSNGKKVRFQRQAVLELGLKNVTPVHARVEEFSDTQGFDQIVSRAFAAVAPFVELTRPLLGADGEWLAMMGRLDTETDIPSNISVTQRIVLDVPGEEGARHLLRLAPSAHTL